MGKKINFEKLLPFLIFSVFFIIGINIYDDYGISWDEYNERIGGFVSLNFVRETLSIETYPGFPKLDDYIYSNYGVMFNLPMAYIEKAFLIDDLKEIFLIRHLFNFIIFFISSIFFFLLLKKRFSKLLSIIGLLFFYLSPRIFADSFYNNKDIIFFSFFIISLFFSINFLNNPNYIGALLSSITCSFAIATRVLGVIVPFVVLVFFILRSLDNNIFFKKNIFKIITYILFLQIFTILFWPYLWIDPITNFIKTLESMSSYPWSGGIFYLGNYISALNLPWHYSILWILISTPILYLFLFFLGSYLIIIRSFKRFINLSEKKSFNDIYRGNKERMDIIFFSIFFLSIILVIELNSTLYNGWRQLYYIYPSLIFISIRGLEFISRKIKVKYTFIFIFPFLIFTSLWMIKHHPFQFTYFNKLAGNNIRDNFEIDYWGVSNLKALNFIAKKNSSKKINVFVLSESPYHWSLLLIDKKDRKRFNFVKNINESNFIVTNHFYQKGNPIKIEQKLNEKFKLFKVFNVNKIPINTIYINN